MPGFFVGFGGLGIFAFFAPGEEVDRPERAAAVRERDNAEDFEDAGGAEGRLRARRAAILGGFAFFFFGDAGGAEADRGAGERAGAVLSRAAEALAAEAREGEEAAFEGDVRAEDFLREIAVDDFLDGRAGMDVLRLTSGLAGLAGGGPPRLARVLADAPAARAGFAP